MTYAAQADLSRDADFADRVAACVAVEGPRTDDHMLGELAVQWAERNIWRVAAAPGFADQYAYAQQTGVERPGRDPGVITDAQLLAAVQALLGIHEEDADTGDGPAEEHEEDEQEVVTGDGPPAQGAEVHQPGVPG